MSMIWTLSALLVAYLHSAAAASPTFAPTTSVPSTASPTSYACPAGYSALNIAGNPAICIQYVNGGSTMTQAEFASLCSSSYNGGYLVQISNTATRDALLTYAAGLQSAGSWSSDRELWVGVQLTSASSVFLKNAFSPYGSAQTSAYNVTSIFTPFASTTLWIATNEPATGDTAVVIQYKSSSGLVKFKGRTNTDNKQYGIW